MIMYFMHRLSNDKVLNLIHLYVTQRLPYETNSTFSSACNVSDPARHFMAGRQT